MIDCGVMRKCKDAGALVVKISLVYVTKDLFKKNEKSTSRSVGPVSAPNLHFYSFMPPPPEAGAWKNKKSWTWCLSEPVSLSLSKRMCNPLKRGCTPWVGQIKRRSNNIEIKLSLDKKSSITPSINQNRGTCQRNVSDLDFKHVSSNRGTQLDIRFC